MALWVLIAFVVPRFTPESAPSVGTFIPVIVLSAFLFETLDSAAGMGFGATLGALLFVLGYDPLAVTPVLLLSETATGLAAGFLAAILAPYTVRALPNRALQYLVPGYGILLAFILFYQVL